MRALSNSCAEPKKELLVGVRSELRKALMQKQRTYGIAARLTCFSGVLVKNAVKACKKIIRPADFHAHPRGVLAGARSIIEASYQFLALFDQRLFFLVDVH